MVGGRSLAGGQMLNSPRPRVSDGSPRRVPVTDNHSTRLTAKVSEARRRSVGVFS